jgi:hypothetical protein
MIDAPNACGMVVPPSSIILKVFDIIHMLWMGRWIFHNVVTIALVGPDLEMQVG